MLRSSPETPSAISAARRRRGVFHWRQRAARSRKPDPASESDQHLGRFAKAEIAAPAPHIRGQIVHCRLDADALGPSRDVPDSRLNRSSDFGAIVRLISGPAVKLNPRNFRSCGRATALFASFTLSLSFCVMKRVMLSITR